MRLIRSGRGRWRPSRARYARSIRKAARCSYRRSCPLNPWLLTLNCQVSLMLSVVLISLSHVCLSVTTVLFENPSAVDVRAELDGGDDLGAAGSNGGARRKVSPQDAAQDAVQADDRDQQFKLLSVQNTHRLKPAIQATIGPKHTHTYSKH